MKLATYRTGGRQSYGVVAPDGLVDIPRAWAYAPRDLLAAIEAGPAVLEQIARLADAPHNVLAMKDISLLAPLPRPPKLIGLAVNYPEHHREMNRGELPADARKRITPRPFLMPATCVIGPGEEIPWPVYSRQIDHEVELAVVIGRRCHRVSPQEARSCIAGFTIANDVSARSCTHAQGRTPRPKDDFFDWLHGKWADGFCPLGPMLVTPDDVGDPGNLAIELSVNGEIRQRSNTQAMIFDVYELVSFCSQIMTLTPGDVIATGTPSGVAQATGKWLQAGDVITCRIETLGELTNTLGKPPDTFYAPCA